MLLDGVDGLTRIALTKREPTEPARFKAGDRIAIQMPNCLAYPVVVFGQ